MRRDIQITTLIHGRDIAGLKEKTIKKQSNMPNPDDVRDVPCHNEKNCSKVSMCIDVMHVNVMIISVGVSRHIWCIECVCIRKKIRELF